MSAAVITATAAVVTDLQLAHLLPLAIIVVGVALLLYLAWRDRGVPWFTDDEDFRRSPAPEHEYDDLERLRRIADRS